MFRKGKETVILNPNETKLINKCMNVYLFSGNCQYTSEELGNAIGVSRPTMINFERDVIEIRMTKAQYIALRTALEARAEELINHDKDDSLGKAIKLVFMLQTMKKRR